MIIFRYLIKEVLISAITVTCVLLFITLSSKFAGYLSQAAAGELAADILAQIILYRIPQLLELILPLSFFLGILLTYGRFYINNEMTVLIACGMSRCRLCLITLIPALMVSAIVAGLSLYISPAGMEKIELLLREQKNLTEFNTLKPQQFKLLERGRKAIYTQGMDKANRIMQDVFISEHKAGTVYEQSKLLVTVADAGSTSVNSRTGNRFLILKDGYRYEGTPGDKQYKVIKFSSFQKKLEERPLIDTVSRFEAISTSSLLESNQLLHKLTFQWRLSLPIVVLIITLLAVPLSKVNPREGRFIRLIPAVLVYLAYISLLIIGKKAVEKGDIPLSLGLWWIHGLFLFLAICLLTSWKFVQNLFKLNQ